MSLKNLLTHLAAFCNCVLFSRSDCMRRFSWAFFCVLFAGCVTTKPTVSPADREMVLTSGTIISVSPLPNKQALRADKGDIPFTGSLQIRGGSGFTRYYTWDGETRSVEMWPRPTRWYGSFGAYFPGPGSHWVSNHGITRGVLEEGQMHFDTEEQAEEWLHLKECAVYTRDGLVVDFYKTRGAGGTLIVNVWQVLIHGQLPSALKGSHDELISVSRKDS